VSAAPSPAAPVLVMVTAQDVTPLARGADSLARSPAQPGGAPALYRAPLDLSPDDDTERAELPAGPPPWSPDDGADAVSEDLTEEITDDDRADASADDDDTRARVAAYTPQARAEILADPVWQSADALVKLTMRLLRRAGEPLPSRA
jgi:hypothetical protein